MRTIRETTQYRKDKKKLLKADPGLLPLLEAVLRLLVLDEPLPAANADHPLKGAWKGYRDCHIRPDVILIYRKPDDTTLDLVRLGSHSELFG